MIYGQRSHRAKANSKASEDPSMARNNPCLRPIDDANQVGDRFVLTLIASSDSTRNHRCRWWAPVSGATGRAMRDNKSGCMKCRAR